MQAAYTPISALQCDDVVEILYKLQRHVGQWDSDVVERWIGAHIVACDIDAWPLARLADGQLTEIRPFMEWRLVQAAKPKAKQQWAA